MFPLIVVSQDKKKFEKFLQNYISQQKFRRDHIFEIYPLKRELVIGQIRTIKRELMIGSKDTRLFVLYDFDKATIEAQNAFLKSLEEQSTNNQFILVVKNEYSLLPTIHSRSKTIKLDKKNVEDEKINKEIETLFEEIEKKSGYGFLADKRVLSLSREEAINLIDYIMYYYRRSLLRTPSFASEILKKALSVMLLVENNNVNPQLALDNLLIFIKKMFKMKVER